MSYITTYNLERPLAERFWTSSEVFKFRTGSTRSKSLRPGIVVDERHCVLIDWRWSSGDGGVVVIIVVMRWLPSGRTRRLKGNCLIIAKSSATFLTLHNGDEALPKFLVEECVQNGIYAGVWRTQPLCQWRDYGKYLLFPWLNFTSKLYPCKNEI